LSIHPLTVSMAFLESTIPPTSTVDRQLFEALAYPRFHAISKLHVMPKWSMSRWVSRRRTQISEWRVVSKLRKMGDRYIKQRDNHYTDILADCFCLNYGCARQNVWMPDWPLLAIVDWPIVEFFCFEILFSVICRLDYSLHSIFSVIDRFLNIVCIEYSLWLADCWIFSALNIFFDRPTIGYSLHWTSLWLADCWIFSTMNILCDWMTVKYSSVRHLHTSQEVNAYISGLYKRLCHEFT
jgi:hypothetical protein